MILEEKIFKKAKPDFEKIKRYGFNKIQDGWVLNKIFMNDAFKCEICIDKNGKAGGVVYDMASGEEYLPLRMEHTTGGFSSEVRAEYEKILYDILKNCFTENYFIYPQANRITELIYKKYSINPDFPWKGQKNASDAGVFRKTSGKWFALIMNIKRDKIIPGAKGDIDIINLKLDEAEIGVLVKKEGFYPAYHMNKKSWLTIAFDETLLDGEIMEFVEKSYKNVK